jgi:hypothetical protein
MIIQTILFFLRGEEIRDGVLNYHS